MLFVMWLAWCVSVMGTPNYDEVDARHEAQSVVQTHGEGPARAAMQELERRFAAR